MHLPISAAHETHKILVDALGTETNPSQWMVFMRAVEEHLPVVSSIGRPSKIDIESSAIGELGFSSWKDMIEAPRTTSGLNWSFNTWKQWTKAWNIVKEHSYLLEQEITASAVMRHKKDFGNEFPLSSEALKIAVEELKEKRKAEANEKVSELKDKIIELEKQLIEASTRLSMLNDQGGQIISLMDRAAELEKKNKGLEKELSKILLGDNKVSRWEHLIKVFTG